MSRMRGASKEDRFDLLVIGGGVIGLTMALAAKQESGGSLSVGLWDPFLGKRSPAQKVSAVAAGSRRLLESVGAWRAIEPFAQPVTQMKLTDSGSQDALRPVLLAFEGEVAPGEAFAHIVGNARMEDALQRRAEDAGVSLRRAAADRVLPGSQFNQVYDEAGTVSLARLVVAADGRRSRLREGAAIGVVGREYGLTAIVCTVGHRADHEGCAIQHFMPSETFASLPLRGRESSIVWTMPKKLAAYLLERDSDDFTNELEGRFGLQFGPLKLLDRPRGFEVVLQLARRLVGSRLALIGDAAHTIHPLAGQGLNLGFRDVASLTETVVAQARLGLDPGEPDSLRVYERSRRFDAVLMGATTDVLDRLFAIGPARSLRDLGLSLIDRAPALKALLINEAAGITRWAPKPLRNGSP